jgi:hypothetical protein
MDMAKTKNPLEQTVAKASHTSLVREMWEFLSVTKKWWLLPIILVFGLLGVLLLLAGTAAAPFIYTVF